MNNLKWNFKGSSLLPELDIVITNYLVAKELASQADLIISINSPEDAHPDFLRGKKHLELIFDDIFQPLYTYKMPLDTDIQQVLDISTDLKGKVLIHCMAGTSRSPAIALAILAKQLKNEYLAFVALNEYRNNSIERGFREKQDLMRPNKYIVEQTGNKLNLKLFDELKAIWKISPSAALQK